MPKMFCKTLLLVVLISISQAKDTPIGPDQPTSTTPETTSSQPSPNSTTTSTMPATTTTTKTTTTSTPPTTTTNPTPPTPVGNWTVKCPNSEKICLKLQGAFTVEVKYQNSTKNFTVPGNAEISSSKTFDNNTENILLSFGSFNSVGLNFNRSNDGKEYGLVLIIISLNQNFVLFHNKTEFSTPLGNSFKCAKKQSLSLLSSDQNKNYTGTLLISNFQMEAFGTTNSAKFNESIDCASSQTSNTVPIAVGCTLAALIAIILAVYCISRRRTQARGYVSIYEPLLDSS